VSAVHKYEDEWDILIIKANEKHYFSTLFDKELYMFRKVDLSETQSFLYQNKAEK